MTLSLTHRLALPVALTGINLVSNAVAQDQPNVLIIHVDEMNYRYLSCNGSKILQTPNIDRLTKEGVQCTNFYANHPVCTPSRGSMMTGRYPHSNGAIMNDHPLTPDQQTFAAQFVKSGYTTGYAGKWHLAGGAKPGWMPEHKFGWQDNRYMFNRGHWKKLELTEAGPRVGVKGGKNSYGVIGDEKTFTTDWLADRAIEFIQKNKAKKFCYLLSIPDPHGPNTVREPYRSMYKDKILPPPLNSDENPDSRPAWARAKGFHKSENRYTYMGMIKCIDDNIGKIIKKLEKYNLLDKTIVIFTADHGDLMGEHGLNNKGNAYNASAKVPFIIRWPKNIPANKVITESMSMIDFGPTVMELANVTQSGKEQGKSAAKLLKGEAQDWSNFSYLCNHGRSGGWLGAATDKYKIVFDHYGEPWLFDLTKDPEETKNFLGHAGYNKIAQDLAKRILKIAQDTKDPLLDIEIINKCLTDVVNGDIAKYKGLKVKIEKTPKTKAKKSKRKAKKKK